MSSSTYLMVLWLLGHLMRREGVVEVRSLEVLKAGWKVVVLLFMRRLEKVLLPANAHREPVDVVDQDELVQNVGERHLQLLRFSQVLETELRPKKGFD